MNVSHVFLLPLNNTLALNVLPALSPCPDARLACRTALIRSPKRSYLDYLMVQEASEDSKEVRGRSS